MLRVVAATLGQHSVDLIDEDYARLVLLCFVEQLADPFGSHTHKHLIEVRTRAVDEAAACLTGDGSCEEGFARAWLPIEEHSLVQIGPLGVVLYGVLHHLDEVSDLLLDFIDALYVIQPGRYLASLFYVKLVIDTHEVLVVEL